MRTKLHIGIGLSSRESAKAAYLESRKILHKYGQKITVEKKLDLDPLSKRTDFLESDLIIVFGGDGSFLKVCQALRNETPVLGIGCGERNFLSQINCHDAPKGIQDVLDHPLSIEKKTRLEVKGIDTPILNELAVVPSHSATVMHYEAVVDDKRLWHDYADGVLIATPTGSSAYNTAAGGPRLLDHTHAIAITPLNSIEKHRPTVTSENATIRIQKIHCMDHPLQLVLDGQQRLPLEENNITISKSRYPAHLIQTKEPVHVHRPQHLEELAPSSRFAYALIRQRGAMTQTELVSATRLDPRTIRRAVKELLDAQAITKRPYGTDQRQDLYHIL